MRTRLIVCTVCAFLYGSTWGAQVLKVAKDKKLAGISVDSDNPWVEGDGFCAVGDKKPLGRIRKVLAKGAIAEITSNPETIPAGMKVVKCTVGTGSHRRTASESVLARKSKKASACCNLSAGARAGFDYWFPYVHFEVGLGNRFALGLMPFFIAANYTEYKVTAYGGFLTGNYFFSPRPYRGFFLQGGAGLYKVGAEFDDGTTESIQPPALLFLLGWRGLETKSFSVALAIGGQYVIRAKPDPAVSNIGLAGIMPQFAAEIGFDF